MKEEKFPNTRKPSHWRVCGEFWNLRGQHNWEGKKLKKKKLKPTEYTPNRNYQGRSSPDARVPTSKRGLNREACAELLRVRTRPECPEDSLRELM